MKEEYAKVLKVMEDITKKLEKSEKKQAEQEIKYMELHDKNIKIKLELEQQKNITNKLKQESKAKEEAIKALQGVQTIKINKATDKELEIKKLWKTIEKEKGITTIMTKENIEMRGKTPAHSSSV